MSRKIKGTITETLTVQKEVEISVSDEMLQKAEGGDSDCEEEIVDLINTKAYENTIFSEKDSHGWEGVGTVEVNVEWKAR